MTRINAELFVSALTLFCFLVNIVLVMCGREHDFYPEGKAVIMFASAAVAVSSAAILYDGRPMLVVICRSFLQSVNQG